MYSMFVLCYEITLDGRFFLCYILCIAKSKVHVLLLFYRIISCTNYIFEIQLLDIAWDSSRNWFCHFFESLKI